MRALLVMLGLASVVQAQDISWQFVDKRLTELERKSDVLNQKMDTVLQRLDAIERKLDSRVSASVSAPPVRIREGNAWYDQYADGSKVVVSMATSPIPVQTVVAAPTIRYSAPVTYSAPMTYSIPSAVTYSMPMTMMMKSYPMSKAMMMGGYGSMMGATRYGASMGNGMYATATGLPPGPGILGVPGAPFPFDGPLRRMMRMAAGYDPGPATVRGNVVAASAGG